MALKELFYDRRPVAMLNPRESRRIDPRWSYTRLSEGLYVDADRTWKTAPAGVPRYHHDFLTGQYIGMLHEGRDVTNFIPNSIAAGAVVGTPGTFPTNWTVSTAGGCAVSVVGTGTEQGVPYVDLRVAGTPTTTDLTLNVGFYGTGQSFFAPVVVGMSMTMSLFAKFVAGTRPLNGANPVVVQLKGYPRTTGGSVLFYSPLGDIPIDTTLKRFEFAYTIVTPTAITYTSNFWIGSATVGVPIDYTVRIGYPQLEY